LQGPQGARWGSEANLVAPSRAITLALAAAALAAPAGASAQGGTAAPPPGPVEKPSTSGGAGYGRVPLPEPRKRAHPRKRGHGRRGRLRRPRRRVTVLRYRFPVAGSFSYGGADAGFGAPRKGHRHQGQDLTASAGTPVVAPHGGVIEAVRYQARGGGHYVVLDSEGEDRDYVFMHLRAGSIPVREGDRVRRSGRIGEVGSSGTSSGPHLHFEVWIGGWISGHPVDPLPLLRRWASP
jgi:murein DD-endopeptidase MepM/ murein hydrolase activator NlpD